MRRYPLETCSSRGATVILAALETRKFSFFHELAKKRDLRDGFSQVPEFKQRFHKWLEEGRLTDSKQIRDLSTILANPAAAVALDQKGVEEALKVLIQADPALESDLFAAVKV